MDGEVGPIKKSKQVAMIREEVQAEERQMKRKRAKIGT